jgi:hypothetical protein
MKKYWSLYYMNMYDVSSICYENSAYLYLEYSMSTGLKMRWNEDCQNTIISSSSSNGINIFVQIGFIIPLLVCF